MNKRSTLTNTPDSCLRAAAQRIFDKKGINILVLDVRNVSTMTDYFIFADGNVERHVQALAKHTADILREMGQRALHVEGDSIGDWIVLDYGDIVIHLMTAEMRERYAIEQIWKEGKVVDVELRAEGVSASS